MKFNNKLSDVANILATIEALRQNKVKPISSYERGIIDDRIQDLHSALERACGEILQEKQQGEGNG